MKKTVLLLFLSLTLSLSGATYYVATDGNDSNPGTIDRPFATWNKLASVLKAGDLAFIRGGVYRTQLSASTSDFCYFGSLSGTADNPIRIFAYPGEKPVLNLDNISVTSSYAWGFTLSSCNYVWIKGLRITGLAQQPNNFNFGFALINSSYNTIENCEVDHIGGVGFSIGENCSYNLIKNCDAHHCADPLSGNDPYGAADGFTQTGNNLSHDNTYSGCRSWWNSDDGWDTYGNNGYIRYENCWAFWNGFVPGTFTPAGDGCGFKLGPPSNNLSSSIIRVVHNCLAFQNRVWGFNDNMGKCNIELYNNTAYQNGYLNTDAGTGGFHFDQPGIPYRIKNNIAFANIQNNAILGVLTDVSNNSWDGSVTTSSGDFASLDNTGVDGPRQDDGSLPLLNFLRLASGSDLIDTGTNVGLPYSGNAPDLGAFEAGSVIVYPVPLYTGSAIQNSTPSLIEMSYNISLANVVPPASAFSVIVNSASRAVTSVSVSGNYISLTLSSPVVYGDVVTVAYTKPSSNPLQTPSGVIAESYSAQRVTNNVAQVLVPTFVSSVIQNSTPGKLEMTFSLALGNNVPAAGAFSVTVNSASRAVNSVAVSGKVVTLTLSAPVAYGNGVTVSYTKPSSSALQTSAGAQVASFGAQQVTNNVGPVTPAFVSASVENAAPTKLVITYNMTLTSIVPSASSFAVSVNSASRTVSSVAVSGTTVTLTLSSAVASGNTIKVSYTKPSSNPIQTPAGGQAASFTGQSVTNKVQVSNTPPVVMVNYQSTTYSGFVNELNASGSYDANSDKLTFSWVVPGNIPVSSTTGSKIEYLSPVTDVARKVQFVVNVSDGKTVQSKTVPVEILPYEPDLDVAEVINIEASGYIGSNLPSNILDGNIGTMWSADGDNQWLLLTLKEPFSVQHVKLAFQPGQKRESYFDILGSDDMVTWEQVLTKSNSCAFTGDPQVFDFPTSKAAKEFRYIKLIGHGNSTDTWNYISEFRIFGYKHKNPSSYEEQPVKIYPNPAHDYFNVKIEETSLVHDFLRIVSMTGSVLFQQKIDPGVNEFRVPINLLKGIYLVQIGTHNITLFSQKLIVGN